MALTYKEFFEEMKKPKGGLPIELCGAGSHPLGKHQDEPARRILVGGRMVCVCDECYYEIAGEEIDRHDAGIPHRVRG